MATSRRRQQNTGYTTREDGTAISIRGAYAEENGKFSEGRFRSFYHVAKRDFNILLSLGLIRSEEWHHTGARFNRSDFYEWSDANEVDYSEVSLDGHFPEGSLAEKYFSNRKAVSALVKESESKPWEYVSENFGHFNIPSFEDYIKSAIEKPDVYSYENSLNYNLIRITGKGIEDYLSDTQKEERQREHSAISRQGEMAGSAAYRRELHLDVDRKYNRIAIDSIPEDILHEAYENAYADDIKHNSEVEGKITEAHTKNTASDGKEKVLIRIAELMGVEHSDAERRAYNASMSNLAAAGYSWNVQKRQEYDSQIDAVLADIEKKQKDYVKKLIKQGRAERRERIASLPQMFATEKEEMNGRYGWFDANSNYNLPRYYTGVEFKDRRGFNHYNEIKKNSLNIIEVLHDKRDYEIASGPSEEEIKRLRMQKSDASVSDVVSTKDAMLRDELIRRMRESGINVVTNERQAQRALERANNRVKFSGDAPKGVATNPVIYTSYNVDDVDALKEKYPSGLSDKYYHHSTVKYGYQPLDTREGKKERLHIIGRLTTDKVDVLVVENPESDNRTPHITLATAKGIKPVASNFELEKYKDKIQPLDDYVDVTFTNNLRNGATLDNSPITPAFKEWFGDWENNPEQASKIVDEQGHPLIVEHGTNNDFTEFDINRLGETSHDKGIYGAGFYFATETPAWLNARNKMKVYLDIKKPFEITASMENDIYTSFSEKLDTPAFRALKLHTFNDKEISVGEYIDVIKAVDDFIEHNPDQVNEQVAQDEELQSYHPKNRLQLWREHEISRRSEAAILSHSWNVIISSMIGSEEFTEAAKKSGYDGIIVNRDEDYREYIAFEPNQIKSATENIGTYRRDSNDIRFQKAEEQPIFISNAMLALDKIKQEKATPEQWLKMLEKNGGIKAGEDRWTGLTGWLRSKNDIKGEQLKLILNSNPHDDSIGFEHTWIRQKEDIKTFEESFREDYDIHESQTPDYTAEMISSALKSGKITVYSSHPIEDGAFVTPSKMEAQNYAGGGQVYSKEINLKDVAWIDPMQGQYAPVKSISLTKSEIVDYLNENMIEVEEVHYQSESSYADSPSFKEFENEFNDIRNNIKTIRQERWEEADNIYASFMSEMQEKYGEDWAYMMNSQDAAKENILLENREQYSKEIEYDIDGAAFDEMVDRYGDDFSLAFDQYKGNLEISNPEYAAYFLELDKEIHSTREKLTTKGLDNNREIALTVPSVEPYIIGGYMGDVHFDDAGDGRAVAWVRFGDTSIEKSEYTNMVEGLLARSREAANERRMFINSMEDKYAIHLNGTFTVKEYNEHLRRLLTENMTQEERETLQRLDSLWHKADDAVGAAVRDRDNHIERVLVIDEIQSKRHQDGREKGYGKSKEQLINEAAAAEQKRVELANKHRGDWETYRNSEEYKAAMRDSQIASDLILKNTEAVPYAPFEKNWQELCMKRMLRYAAENGFDRVAWTTGLQQSERYAIGGAVSDIQSYDLEDKGQHIMVHMKDRQMIVFNIDDNGTVSRSDNHGFVKEGQALSEIIGKALSDKIINREGKIVSPDWSIGENIKVREIEGKDLQIGGEGMKTFYDSILVKFTDKYTKQWGVKTEDVLLPELTDEEDNKGVTMHSVPVTEQMRIDVMQGQPMFFKTQAGTAYGFALDGKIFVDTKIATAETPIHEYTHLWAEVLREQNPREWKNIVSLMKGAPEIWNKVVKQYPELHSDNEIADEVLAQYSGKRGYEKLMQMHSDGEVSKDALDKLMQALEKLWKKIAEFFSIHYTSKEEVADRVLRDLLSGVNPRQEVEKYLKRQDKQYMKAVERGDEKKVQEIFQKSLRFAIGNGMTPYIAVDGYRGKLAGLARKVKTMDKTAINTAAEKMAPLIPRNAILVPAPSHKGEATDMLKLAKAISRRRHVEVMDVLKSYERERQYTSKKFGGKAISSDNMGIVAIKDIPEGKIPVVIDNVVSTGNTAEACVKALGFGIVVSLADATTAYKHTASLKSAAPVMRNQAGEVIPLSKRFDLSGAKYIGHAAALQKMDSELSLDFSNTREKSNSPVQGLEGYTQDEIKDIVESYVQDILDESDIDATIEKVAVIGSRSRNEAKTDSDLDILLEYSGEDYPEDAMYNLLHDDENPLEIEGLKVDINPINPHYSLSTEEWLARDARWREEDKKKVTNNKNTQNMKDSFNTAKLQEQAVRMFGKNFMFDLTNFSKQDPHRAGHLSVMEKLDGKYSVSFADKVEIKDGILALYSTERSRYINLEALDTSELYRISNTLDEIKAFNSKLSQEFDKILDDNKDVLDRLKNSPVNHSKDAKPYIIHIGTDDRNIVEGEFHVQFTDDNIKLNFDDISKYLKENGGVMRLMDGKPWFDFYDKGSAEKFAEQITSIGKNITNTINSKEMEKQNENKAGREPMKKIEVLKWAMNHIGANHGSKALEINFEPDYYGITIGNNVPALADVQKMCDDLGISRESVQSKGHTIQVQLPKDWPDTIGQEQYIPTGNEMWKRANKEIGSHLGYFAEGYDPGYERGVGKTVFFDDLQKAKEFCDKESQRAKTGVWHEVYEVAHETRTPALYVSSWDNKENKVVDITSDVYKYEESNDKNLNDSILRPDLIKRVGELGLDYTPVGLSKGINIEVENEDGEKKPMTVQFASVSDKNVMLFANVYDVFDDSKGVSIDELPEYKKATIFESLRATLANGGEKQIVIVQDKADVPSYALPAIINGDFSGIDNEQDEKDIRAFMDKNAGCIYDIQPGSEGFIPFPAFGKGADCETVFIVKPTTPEKLLEEKTTQNVAQKSNEKLSESEVLKGKATVSPDGEVVSLTNDKGEKEDFRHVHGGTHDDPALLYSNTCIDVYFYDTEKKTIENIDNEAGIDNYTDRKGIFLVRADEYNEAYYQLEAHDRSYEEGEAAERVYSRYKDCEKENGEKPLYAEVTVLFNGETEKEEMIIKLSNDIDERDDEKVFFNVDGLDGLRKLMSPDNGEDFKIVDQDGIDFLPASTFLGENKQQEKENFQQQKAYLDDNLRRAKEAFEKGDVKLANQLFDEIEKNAEQHMAQFEATQNLVNQETTLREKKSELKELFNKLASPEKELTPMMKQFYDLKEKHPDAMLLFRTGDFYETYEEDAKEAAKVLGITLTKSIKQKNAEGKPLSMAGFPYHALDTYLPKLIRSGHRVAICDQLLNREELQKQAKGRITETVGQSQELSKETAAKQVEKPEQEQVKDNEVESTALFKDKKIWNLVIITPVGEDKLRQVVVPSPEDIDAFFKEAKGKTKDEVESLRNALGEKYLAKIADGSVTPIESRRISADEKPSYVKQYAELMVAKIREMKEAQDKGDKNGWKKPWIGISGVPRSIYGNAYVGANNFLLSLYSEKMGYKVPVFATHSRFDDLNFTTDKRGKKHPATDKNGNTLPKVHILKGEHSFPVWFTNVSFVNKETKEKISYKEYRQLSKEEREAYEIKRVKGRHNVFCVEQTNLKDARPELYKKLSEPYTMRDVTKQGQAIDFTPVDLMVSEDLWICPINIKEGSDRAFFRPGDNTITLPAKTQFFKDEDYYSTMFHEMGHSTGIGPLHNRDFGGEFGSPQYAKEELVAELTAAIVASQQGMSKEIKEESAKYLSSWLDAIEADPEFLMNVLHDVDKASATINLRIADIQEQLSKGIGADYSEIREMNNDLRSRYSPGLVIAATEPAPESELSVEEEENLVQEESQIQEAEEQRGKGLKM